MRFAASGRQHFVIFQSAAQNRIAAERIRFELVAVFHLGKKVLLRLSEVRQKASAFLFANGQSPRRLSTKWYLTGAFPNPKLNRKFYRLPYRMPRVVPAARIRIVVESISALRRLRSEISGFSHTGKDYEHHKRALDETIKELRKSVRRISK
jgi:hypothetical protein